MRIMKTISATENKRKAVKADNSFRTENYPLYNETSEMPPEEYSENVSDDISDIENTEIPCCENCYNEAAVLIKTAIEKLADCGNEDEIAKEAIGNLSIVLFTLV